MSERPPPTRSTRTEVSGFRFSDADFLVKASADTTGGAFAIIEELAPLDTPLHVHANEDELFLVLEGEHVFQVGEEEFPVGPGGVVFAPRGVPHAQRRVVPRTGRTLSMMSPAGLEGFFRELSEAEGAGTIGREAYASASEKYGITWVASPPTSIRASGAPSRPPTCSRRPTR